MLSLKEFKEFKIDENMDNLSMIKGGIDCEGVYAVMRYLCEHNPAQADAIVHTFLPKGLGGDGYVLQATDGPC